jgi:hypothetical protein
MRPTPRRIVATQETTNIGGLARISRAVVRVAIVMSVWV